MLMQRFINTLPNRKDRINEDFDVGQMNFDRKRTEEGKINKTCVSSQNHRMKKEEGATVGVCRPFCSLPSLSGPLRCFVTGRTGSVLHGSFTLQERPIKYRKCPTFDAKRDFQNSTDWPSKTDETNTKRCSRV